MKTTTTLFCIVLFSVFILSCKGDEKIDRKAFLKAAKKHYDNQKYFKPTINKIKNKKTGDIVFLAATNNFNICDKSSFTTSYQRSHLHCSEELFELKTSLKVTKDENNSYKLDTFSTKIVGNTIYYLKKDGMKVIKPFAGETKFLEINVLLTENENESEKIVTLNMNEMVNKNLNVGDILDFHLIKPDGNRLGDTNCPNSLIKHNNIDDYDYNFCASQITCE
ncbi:MAG: hypothetical protein V3U80_01310 [Flavobacteriaceae bacterium]